MKLKSVNVEPDELEEEEYREFLGDYLSSKAALRQSRAIRSDVRYIVFRTENTIYAVEEKGDWLPRKYDFSPENEYRKICRNGTRKVEEEEVDWERAQQLLTDYSNLSA